jgi:hypothetical protein
LARNEAKNIFQSLDDLSIVGSFDQAMTERQQLLLFGMGQEISLDERNVVGKIWLSLIFQLWVDA